jgi:putative oxidoreductase
MKSLLDLYRKTASWVDGWGSWTYAAARLVLGCLLAFNHGLGKLTAGHAQMAGWLGSMGLPLPGLFAYLSGLAEFLGGLMLAVGLFARPAALAIIINMSVALLAVHHAALFAGPDVHGGEMAWLYFLPAVLFASQGPGKISLDSWWLKIDNRK